MEYTQAQINNEIDGTPAGFVRESDIHGHGTHVAGIAAGNGGTLGGKFTGMAPGADIVVVKGGNASFSETRMIDGLTYAHNIAAALENLWLSTSASGATTGRMTEHARTKWPLMTSPPTRGRRLLFRQAMMGSSYACCQRDQRR